MKDGQWETVHVVITGGGTGGHIYPGLAVAEALAARHPQVRVAFIGTEKGLEADIIPRAGHRFFSVPSKSLARRASLSIVSTAWTVGLGVREAWRLLGRLRPRGVLGTGGYVAAPVGAASIVRRIPLLLQEQNAWPGLTNRLLARFARTVALGSPAAQAYFPRGTRTVVTGNPIRKAITAVSREDGLRRMGLSPHQRVVLVMGASQGARSINEAVLAGADRLRQRPDLQLVLSTGRAHFDAVCRQAAQRWGPPVEVGPGVRRWGDFWVRSYIEDMGAALAAADLVVGRAGAISIAEITARGVAAILVPYPYAAEGHQEKNARELEAAQAAWVVLDHQIQEQLVTRLLQLLDDPARLEAMRQASARLGRPDAADRVVDLLETWLSLS